MLMFNYSYKLIGVNVLSAQISGDARSIVLETDKGIFDIQSFGDCCASCYFYHVSGIDALVGATIEKIESLEWTNVTEYDYEVVESSGVKIKTNKGYVDLETRLEHNGYYGGWLEVREEKDPDSTGYKPLTDF